MACEAYSRAADNDLSCGVRVPAGPVMGRHRRYLTTDGNVKRTTAFTDTESVHETAEDRLGLTGMVCTSCDARNPSDADACRRCGEPSLRRKRSEFANER